MLVDDHARSSERMRVALAEQHQVTVETEPQAALLKIAEAEPRAAVA